MITRPDGGLRVARGSVHTEGEKPDLWENDMIQMKILQRRDIIRKARGRFLKQYERYPDDWRGATGRPLGAKRKALAALDLETCSPADVDAAIGTRRWADNRCDRCGADCHVLLRLGGDPDDDIDTVDMCLECLGKAVVLLASTEVLK